MEITNNKLLLFGGKGGVGKTSVASAVALHESKNKKVLILSTDPAHSLSDSFEIKIGNKTTKINENLDALEIDAGELLKDYKEKYSAIIRQIADEGTFFSKEDIQKFFNLSLPGMDELMALIKITDILEEDNYDLLILDTAPTGHTIRLLEMPELMATYIRVLAEMRMKHRVVIKMMIGRYVKDKADHFIEKMQKDIERVKTTLKALETKFIPIIIPEAMSIYETERLVSVLEKHKIPIKEIILNGVIKNNCEFCKIKQTEQTKYFNEIQKKFSKYQVNEIPLFATEVKGSNLEIMAKILFNEKYEFPKQNIKRGNYDVKFDTIKIKPGLTFLLFGGKGGVGKTSMASAVALHESKNKKVLVFSTDPAHSLSDSFEVQIGNKITKINENLDALEIDAYSLLEELKTRYKTEIDDFFKSILQSSNKITIDIPYDRRVITDLINLAPPGLDEIMALKTMMDMIEIKENKKKYDLLILDTAPTGHTIRLLEMPEIAEQWIATLIDILEQYPLGLDFGDVLEEMLEAIKQIRKMLANPKETEFISVTIPEAMSVLETKDLIDSLRRLKIPFENLIINKIIPKKDCDFCMTKRAEQFIHTQEILKFNLKTIGVELFDKEIKGKETLEQLSKRLYNLP